MGPRVRPDGGPTLDHGMAASQASPCPLSWSVPTLDMSYLFRAK